MKVGLKIRKIRELRNYSQDFMASELGIAQRSYSSIELDETSPSLVRLGKIAHLLQVSVADILRFDPKSLFIPEKDENEGPKTVAEQENSSLLQIIELKDEIIRLKNMEIEILKAKLNELYPL